jgi:signal transduction histidine kinase
LQNIGKSANASQAIIRLSGNDGLLAFSVEDDGCGFDPKQARAGSGLQNMRDRIEALGGTLDIQSAPGRGTQVKGRVQGQTVPSAISGAVPHVALLP